MFNFFQRHSSLSSFKDTKALMKFCQRRHLKLNYEQLGTRIQEHCPELALLFKITALLPLTNELSFNFLLHTLSAKHELFSCKTQYKLAFYYHYQQQLKQQVRKMLADGCLVVEGNLIVYKGSLRLYCRGDCSHTGFALFITDICILKTLDEISELNLNDLLEEEQIENERLKLSLQVI